MADEKSTFQVLIMERREGEFKALQKEKERRLEELRYRRQQEREVRAKGAVCFDAIVNLVLATLWLLVENRCLYTHCCHVLPLKHITDTQSL